jgi:hypothetical protein
MLKIASLGHLNLVTLKAAIGVAGAAALVAGIALAAAIVPAAAEGPAAGKIPALAANGLGWISVGGFLDPPPGTGHGPIKQDPAHPFHGNLDGPGQVTPTIGNVKDPVLKPWAAAQMQVSNEEVLAGKRGLPFSAQGRCYPGGVPGQLLYPIEPMYFIQTSNQVWMIWQRDHMVRRIHLTDRHSEHVSRHGSASPSAGMKMANSSSTPSGFPPISASSTISARRTPKRSTWWSATRSPPTATCWKRA